LIATITWLLDALGEWSVVTFSPEANNRVDLMLFWPVVALLSAYGLLRHLR
jgi:hypothetical protein